MQRLLVLRFQTLGQIPFSELRVFQVGISYLSLATRDVCNLIPFFPFSKPYQPSI